MSIGKCISIIILSVNGLNSLTKNWLAEWIQKQDPYIYAVYKKSSSDLKTHRLKVRGWKNIFHVNGKQKKAGVAILISEKKIELKDYKR